MNFHSGLVTFTVFIITSVVGLLIFTRGFLLSRIAITNSTLPSTNTTLSPQYRKAILIIIDALRFDFVDFQPSSNAYYHNKLAFVHNLLTENSKQTRLYNFVADPPTTTMQRLKGLTTGGLPTFVDAGSNFASSEINEDNIIQQLVYANETCVFMGDDTWESLFPKRFSRSYPFPSFNVHDLHTVDGGVKTHLVPEIVKSDFTLLVAHFLGVDHCGHRYGPNHPAMAEKLSEMNEVLRSVVEVMDNETLLIVLGDHGMTTTGDHGGDSSDEINAALLVHTKSEVTWPVQEQKEVSQIDLVPTLSLLLGLPIPYSNLGSLIPELIQNTNTPTSEANLLAALKLNQKQILNYIKHYSQLSNDLPKSQMAVLDKMERALHSSSSEADLQRIKYMTYMRKVKDMCREIWAKFDDKLMLIGGLQVLFSIVLQACSTCGFLAPTSSYTVALLQCSLTVMSLVLSYLTVTPLHCLLILSAMFSIIIVYCVVKYSQVENCLSLTDMLSILCLVLYSLSSLSNSLLINEDKVLHFSAQSILMTIYLSEVIKLVRFQMTKTKEKTTSLMLLKLLLKSPITYLFITLSVVVQLSQVFRACREELIGCETSLFLTPLASLLQEFNSYRNKRFLLLTMPSVFLPAYAVKRILKVRGNLNGHSVLVIFVSYALYTMATLCLADWVSAAIPFLHDWQRTLPAKSTYILLTVGISIILISPLAVYLSSPKSKPVSYNTSVPSIYKYIKETLSKTEDDSERPLVFGLSTVYSATYVALLVMVSIYLMLISGDGMSFSITLALLALVLFLDTHVLCNQSNTPTSISHIIYWFVLCKYYFYCTGHQPTITNIRWDAAFHGFSQDHDTMIVPGILLFTSTFSSQVIFTVSLPLLLIVTESGITFYQSVRSPKARSLTGLGEISLTRQEETTSNNLYHLYSVYLLANLVKTFGALLSAAILRRHLMVWKIFAPAFIYEGASFILTSLISILSYIIFIRLHKAVKYYIRDFELEHVD